MRITERDYDAFAEDQFPNMNLIRAWGDCKIWSAGLEQPLLVLMHNTSQHVAIFEYDTLAERAEDIQLVCHFPENEGASEIEVPAAITRNEGDTAAEMTFSNAVEPSVPAVRIPLPPQRASRILKCFRWIRMQLSSKKRKA